MKVLFVCTGNICRSPTAEAVLRAKDVENRFMTDSAATHRYHIGSSPDQRAIQVAGDNGVSMAGQKARAVEDKDFEQFDLIVAMDQGHFQLLKAQKPSETTATICLFSDYCFSFSETDVPDPYYGDIQDFRYTYSMIEEGIEGLIKDIYG